MTPTPDWNKPLPRQLPQPSYAPALLALGLTLALWGLVTTWILSAVGLAVTALAAAFWLGNVGVGSVAVEAQTKSQGPSQGPAAATRSIAKTMDTPWLHRSALLLAVLTLALVVLGSGVTSQAGRAWEVAHLVVGTAAGLLTLAVALLVRNRLGWILLAGILVQVALGSRSPSMAALHASLAHLYFAATVAAALVTSPGWKRAPEIAPDMAKPSLRTLSLVTVVLLVAQIALGACVRHKLMGSGLHITFAMVVALSIVVLGVLVMNQCATHRILRPAAIAMMVIAGAQVFLGFAAFIVRLMADENTLPVRIATMAHVTTGALTLAATVVLALEIRRNLRRAPTGSADAAQPSA